MLTAMAHAWRSEDNTEELVLSTFMWDLESDLMVVTLSASTFARLAVPLPSLLIFFIYVGMYVHAVEYT